MTLKKLNSNSLTLKKLNSNSLTLKKLNSNSLALQKSNSNSNSSITRERIQIEIQSSNSIQTYFSHPRFKEDFVVSTKQVADVYYASQVRNKPTTQVA